MSGSIGCVNTPGEINQGDQVSRLHVWLIVVLPTEYRRKSKFRVFKKFNFGHFKFQVPIETAVGNCIALI